MMRGKLAMMAALSMGLGSFAGSVQAAPTVQVNAPRHAKKGLFGGSWLTSPMQYGYKGAGISIAQQKRAARKVRNVRRHRAASKR